MPQDSHGYLSLAFWFFAAFVIAGRATSSILSQYSSPEVQRGDFALKAFTVSVGLIVMVVIATVVNLLLAWLDAFEDVSSLAKWAFILAGAIVGSLPQTLRYLANTKQNDV